MQHEKVAIAWVLLVLLGLLLGLVLAVLAFGVIRHLRRQRSRMDDSDRESLPADRGTEWGEGRRRSMDRDED